MTIARDVEHTGESDVPFMDTNPPDGAYAITAVSPETRDWPKDEPKFRSYRVGLRNHDGRELGNVEVSRPLNAAAPRVGEQLSDGKVDREAKYGPKWVTDRKAGSGGGGGFRRASDPAERRSIEAQVCVKGGVALATALIEAGVVKPGSATDAASMARLAAEHLHAGMRELIG